MTVSALGDAKESLPIATRMLTGHETHPRSEMPTIGKLGSVADGGDDRRRSLWCQSAGKGQYGGQHAAVSAGGCALKGNLPRGQRAIRDIDKKAEPLGRSFASRPAA